MDHIDFLSASFIWLYLNEAVLWIIFNQVNTWFKLSDHRLIQYMEINVINIFSELAWLEPIFAPPTPQAACIS